VWCAPRAGVMTARVLVDATAISVTPSGVRTRVVCLFSAYRAMFDDPTPVVVVTKVSGLAEILGDAGVTTISVPARPGPAQRMLANSRTWSRRLGDTGAAALHLETPPVPRHLGVPMALELHDLRSFDDLAFALTSRGIYQRYFLRSAVRRVDHVITPTRYGASIIAGRLRVEPATIHVVPGAGPPHATAPSQVEIDQFLQRHGATSPFILGVGHLERRKNFGLLIDAVRMLDAERGVRHSVVIIGQDHGRAAELRRFASEPPAVALTLTGAVSESEKWAAIAGASCLVMPSLVEGFGLVAVEAMSLGCPVLAAKATALPEVVGDGALLFDPRDASELGSCLRSIMTDGALAAGLVERGTSRSAEFTWSASAERLHAAYEELLS